MAIYDLYFIRLFIRSQEIQQKRYTKFYTSDIIGKNDKEEVIYVWLITT